MRILPHGWKGIDLARHMNPLVTSCLKQQANKPCSYTTSAMETLTAQQMCVTEMSYISMTQFPALLVECVCTHHL
jgi:hypothetical protein